MSRITSKGQVTIPKKIRDQFDIKENDIGLFEAREGKILFTVKIFESIKIMPVSL